MALDLMSGGLIAALAGMAFLVFIISLGMYIFLSLAFMSIGRKAKLNAPGLAWIPGIGPLIISFQASKMHWWPWLLLIGAFIPVIGIIFSLAFSIFVIIWQWKMFEAIKEPGYWSLLCLIPVLNLILYGIAAWRK